MYLQVTEVDQAQGDLTTEMVHGLLSEAVARGCPPQTTAAPARAHFQLQLVRILVDGDGMRIDDLPGRLCFLERNRHSHCACWRNGEASGRNMGHQALHRGWPLTQHGPPDPSCGHAPVHRKKRCRRASTEHFCAKQPGHLLHILLS